MGREARVLRDRRCRNCKRPIIATGKQMQNHAWVCRRVAELGLVMPSEGQRLVTLTDR